jgi:hypothetical protein
MRKNPGFSKRGREYSVLTQRSSEPRELGADLGGNLLSATFGNNKLLRTESADRNSVKAREERGVVSQANGAIRLRLLDIRKKISSAGIQDSSAC